MSVEDIRHALENRIGLQPERLSSADLTEAGCLVRVCVLPENLNERLSYLGDVLVQAVKPEDAALRMTMGTLCQAMSYMFNSASWRDGVLHDFDAEELTRKLERIR